MLANLNRRISGEVWKLNMIKFSCKNCGKPLKVKNSGAGKTGRCPKCSNKFTVPQPERRKPTARRASQPGPGISGANSQSPKQSFIESDPDAAPGSQQLPDSNGADAGRGRHEQPGDKSHVDSSRITGDMTTDDFIPVLNVGHGLQPERNRSQTMVFRLVSGLVIFFGLAVITLNTTVYRKIDALVSLQVYDFEKVTEALEPLGIFGAIAQIGVCVSGLVMVAGGLMGLAISHYARGVTLTGLVLLILVHIGHMGVGFIGAIGPYIGPAGHADTVGVAAVLVLSMGLIFYFKETGRRVVKSAKADDFANIASLVERIFQKAYDCRASDVHIEPTREETVVRFRVDGVMHTAVSYPKRAMERIISRLKVLADMDIAEKKVPQDGGTSMTLDGKLVDLRVSTVPSKLGERAVIRILDQESKLLSLSSLGMAPKLLNQIHHIVQQPHGMFFCTGPTGSGKTTTLYAALMHINRSERNVMTVEDPVEYHLPGIAQLPIKKSKGMSFADGMRSILRQDPDVIMVGEVRDQETAKIAVEASQTGHLVLSTLHTNDTAGAVSRLLDLQVEPFLLSSSLSVILAQRLVRRLCVQCREPYEPDKSELLSLGMDSTASLGLIYRARGCAKCLNTGYYGRIGIYELLLINDKIEELINKRANTGAIRREAVNSGMQTLHADGIQKVLSGATTVEEVRRVTQHIRLE